jgi:hypothetical protein
LTLVAGVGTFLQNAIKVGGPASIREVDLSSAEFQRRSLRSLVPPGLPLRKGKGG